MEIFKKKFIPIQTYKKKFKNNNNIKSNSLLKINDNQSLLNQNNDNDNGIKEDINLDNTIHTKSIKNTASDNPLYIEHKNYDIESSKNFKNISKIKDNTSFISESMINSKINSDLSKNKINELLKYKIYCDNILKNSDINSNKSIKDKKINKSENYLIKNSPNESRDKISETYNSKKIEPNLKSNENDSISNNFDINKDIHNKKGLIFNYNQMNNNLKKNKNQRNSNKRNKIFKSQSYFKYYDLIKNGKDNKSSKNSAINIKNNNETGSTNDFTKLKSKYLELKETHDFTLLKLKKEKNKNKKQKEEIEFMINSIKSVPNKDNEVEELNELVKKLKEENDTFRQELVLSQALINSLKSELKNSSKNNIINNNNDNIIEDISTNDKKSYLKLNNKVNNKNNIELIKEINELNLALNKKNEVLDSILIENKKLRNELKNNNGISHNYRDLSNDKISDLIRKDAIDLINKYNKYRESNKDDFDNLILTENFFNELEKIKKKIDNNNNRNNTAKIIDYYLSLVKLLTNEFDKLLLYNNNFWKEKYLNKYKESENNKNNIIELNFDKVKHNLMDLCLLSTSFIKGTPKDLLLEGINLIKNLENLYKEKNRIKSHENNDFEKINELIMKQENQLENIKRQLNYNQRNYGYFLSNCNSSDNIKNVLGLTYMTNYYNNNNPSYI